MKKYQFGGKTAVITGAAGGIGAALSRILAQRGSDLALVDRDGDGLEAVAAGLRSRNPRIAVTTHVADLAEHSDFAALADDIQSAHPRIGLLINNAGVALGGTIDDVSLRDFDWIMAINFRAPVALTKAFLPALRAVPGSHIANVSSLFGLIAPAGQAAYSSSKFAIRGFTLALQAELIPSGIGVTVIHPGGIATNIATNARLGEGLSGDPQAAADAVAQISALLTMSPDDAAALIVNAIERRRERLVITRKAITADRIVRLMPVRQREIIARSMRA